MLEAYRIYVISPMVIFENLMLLSRSVAPSRSSVIRASMDMSSPEWEKPSEPKFLSNIKARDSSNNS